MADGRYAPYYPGDWYVDWLASLSTTSVIVATWRERDLRARQVPQQLHASYTGNGANDDEWALSDFYHDYAANRGKPLSLSET